MKKLLATAFLVLAAGCARTAWSAPSASDSNREYRVKVGFLYNFMKFTEWPGKTDPNSDEDGAADRREPMRVGVIGKDPFGASLDGLKNKTVRGRKIVPLRFRSFEDVEQSGKQLAALRQCHVLFVCPSEEDRFRAIMKSIEGQAMLTVGDRDGFLESGGIVNFVTEETKIRFEVNIPAAKRAKLKLSSKLLSLAKRIIEEK
jgi:hypothetical protein